jgi:hypothetical protein
MRKITISEKMDRFKVRERTMSENCTGFMVPLALVVNCCGETNLISHGHQLRAIYKKHFPSYSLPVDVYAGLIADPNLASFTIPREMTLIATTVTVCRAVSTVTGHTWSCDFKLFILKWKVLKDDKWECRDCEEGRCWRNGAE